MSLLEVVKQSVISTLGMLRVLSHIDDDEVETECFCLAHGVNIFL